AAVTALCLGGVTSAFIAPVALLHTTTHDRRSQSVRSLLAASVGTQAYLEFGPPAARGGHTYYPITSAHLAKLAAAPPSAAAASSPARVGLSFDTASPELLGEVLRAGAAGGRVTHVSLAVRTLGRDGRPRTELVDTFTTGRLTSFTEHLSGTPTGSV